MKGKSIIEVLLVYICISLISWVLRALLADLFILEIEILGWSYIGGTIQILITLFILLILKGDLKSYGIRKRGWKFSLDIGLTSWLVILIPISVLIIFQLNYMGFLDAIILAGCEVIAIVLILLIIRGRNEEDYERDSSKSRTNVIIIVLLLLFPILLGLFFNKSTNIMIKIISTVIWQFIFSGFGEELRYRGYYLSRINKEFGRPYELLGVKFGLGLIVSSLLFGLTHVLNPFSPFEGKFEFAWWWGLWTFFTGLFFGFLKEKTNNIIAPGVAHGSDAIGEALNLIFS